MKSVAVALLLLAGANADIYMHNPRGSNDRNCERNVNRNNGNRLFDSQNNAKGGYACPRAVGDESVQDEDGVATLGSIQQDMKVYYYEGSYLPIEWTNQHGCGNNSKANCEIVIQYMCEDTADPQVDDFWPWTDTKNNNQNAGLQAFRSGDNIAAPRDGIPTNADDAATDTIPDTLDAAVPDNANDRRYGMHESYDFYQLCQRTERNKGLYTADQAMRRNDQRGTRQNPNGNRRGLECPEERDYYPWWHPSPWVDIAVLTNDAGSGVCTDPDECETARCKYYLENSFNVNKKGYCDVDHTSTATNAVQDKTTSTAWNSRVWYNNKDDCETAGFTWYEVALNDYINVTYPECRLTGFSRVNQLGNALDNTVSADFEDEGIPTGVNANRYLWQIPEIPGVINGDEADYFTGVDSNGMEDAYKSCVLRIRYNLSTSDFPAWPADAMENGHPWKNMMVDHRNNSVNGDTSNTPLTQDPYIYIGTTQSSNELKDEMFVSLAVNTNQYARTFQDRSYKFAIKKRPSASTAASDTTDRAYIPAIDSDTKIYNVNVRGKRGNIVQTYPAVEYDFIPNSLALEAGDLVHFQWTGSDYNPRRGCNDAEGGPPDPNNFVSSDRNNARADRNNLIFMTNMAMNTPREYAGYDAYTSTDDDNPSGLTFAQKTASMRSELTGAVPCDIENDDNCYDLVMRLAYLNQQDDKGSLNLRRSADCLTQDELDAINNQDEREQHPLNCAKLNAKPYPYFDAGVMTMEMPGMFSFFSSRNNNFSNRDQTGIMCIKGTDDDGNSYACDTDDTTGVLQDQNPATSNDAQRVRLSNSADSDCIDQASENGGTANDQGATSCITDGVSTISGGSFTTEQAANDAMGDGDKRSCEEIVWFFKSGSVTSYIVLAIILAFVGFGAAWISVFCYNRVKKAREEAKDTEFTGHTSWKKDTANPNMI